MLSDLATGGPTREAATDVFLRELPAIAEHGAVLILDDFHLVDESPDVRIIARDLVARAPERLSIVFASRQTPPIPFARLRASGRGRRDRDRRPPVRRRRDGAALLRDVRARARARRPRRRRRADRGLGRLAPARPGRAARSVAGRDPTVRPRPDRRRPGALRLPRRGGRRRPAGRPAAVPDADLDPPGRVARSSPRSSTGLDAREVARLTAAAERLTLLTRPSRYVDAAGSATTRSCASSSRRGCARRSGRGRAPELHRRAAEAAAATDWRVAAYHYREAGDPSRGRDDDRRQRSPRSWAAASTPPRSRRSTAYPTELRLPVLSLVTSRIQLQHRDYDSAIELSHAILERRRARLAGERLRPPEPGDAAICKRARGHDRGTLPHALARDDVE